MGVSPYAGARSSHIVNPNLANKSAASRHELDPLTRVGHQEMDERNIESLDYLASTVSGEAMVSELEKKRKRYLDRIQEAIASHEQELKEKDINTETLLRDLELVAQQLIQRNDELNDFFKTSVKIEKHSKAQPNGPA